MADFLLLDCRALRARNDNSVFVQGPGAPFYSTLSLRGEAEAIQYIKHSYFSLPKARPALF